MIDSAYIHEKPACPFKKSIMRIYSPLQEISTLCWSLILTALEVYSSACMSHHPVTSVTVV